MSLFNEVQLLSHVAGSERVVTCDHDHLGRGRRLSGAGLRASELQPGDLGAKSLLRTAIEEALGSLVGDWASKSLNLPHLVESSANDMCMCVFLRTPIAFICNTN